MSETIITTIPVRNGAEYIVQTFESLARQTRRPDRIIVLDNCSTDETPELARTFKGLEIEYIRNPVDLGLFGNFNRCLDFATETDYLHILHADDLVTPDFYRQMVPHLADCKRFGLAWCLDERIDEQNRSLSVSGKPDGKVEVLDRDKFLRCKAEIGNQAFAATLLKTNHQPVPCLFPTDMPILGDMVYWGDYGRHCDKIVHVRSLLAKYRWHGINQTSILAPSIDALILDEWKAMQFNEQLRGFPTGMLRSWKLRGLLAVRSGIKAKRFRQQGNKDYSKQIAQTAQGITGWPLWVAGQMLVELRDLIVYTILKRPRHPKNVFS